MAPQQKRKNPEEAQPSAPKAAPVQMNLLGFINARWGDVLKALGLTAKVTGAAVVVGTDEGRELLGEAWETAGTGVEMGVRSTERMIFNKILYTAYSCLMFVLILLSSAFLSHWEIRIPTIAVLFSVFILGALWAIRATALWYIGSGVAWRGLEQFKQDAVKEAIKGNPLPLIFAAFQPSVQGGLDQIWAFIQFQARTIAHVAVSALYVTQPFHQQPVLLWFSPFFVFGFVTLAMGYRQESKGHHWFLYLFTCLAGVTTIALLAWNPWVINLVVGEPWVGLKPMDRRNLIVSLILSGLVWYGVKWASRQAENHQAKLAGGKGSANGNDSSSRRRFDGDAGRVLLVPAIVAALVIVVGIRGGKAFSDATDGFHKVTGVVQPWLAKHNFDQTGGGLRGSQAIPGEVQPTDYETSTKSIGGHEIIRITERLPVRLGAVASKYVAQDGDSVLFVSQTQTYRVYDSSNGVVTLRLGGYFLPGTSTIAVPEHFPERMEHWRNDYPSVRLADSALLGRVGQDGPLFEIGARRAGQIDGSGRLYYLLNLPQRDQFRSAVVEDQTIDLTITVKRPRRT